MSTKAEELIQKAANARASKLEDKIAGLEFELKERDARLSAYAKHLEQSERIATIRVKKLVAPKRAKAAKHVTRVIIPDSHGAHIDPVARDAFLTDLKLLCPEEIVMLGDHLDCGGTFNAHQVSYTNELVESYEEDVCAANAFLDAIIAYAPNARIHYIEGNHEAHVERWAARNVKTRVDADSLIEHWGPAARLKLKARGITYYRSKEFHMGLSTRGSIRIGRCFFTHGVSHSKHADDAHLHAFSGNVVFGHVHRILSVHSRTVTSQGHAAWSPGTLAKLQPLYRHTEPTTWGHGYAVQFVSSASGRFTHLNIPIFADATTGLAALAGAFSRV
jgi:predicted phosphodiesterase